MIWRLPHGCFNQSRHAETTLTDHDQHPDSILKVERFGHSIQI